MRPEPGVPQYGGDRNALPRNGRAGWQPAGQPPALAVGRVGGLAHGDPIRQLTATGPKGEAEAALQTQINGFDADRNGYSELEEWTAELDALGAKLATTEEKWLALAERA